MELLKASGKAVKEKQKQNNETEEGKETLFEKMTKKAGMQPTANFRDALKQKFEFLLAISKLPPATQVLLRILHKPVSIRTNEDKGQLAALIKDHKFVQELQITDFAQLRKLATYFKYQFS